MGSSELGGTVRVIDPVRHVVTHKILGRRVWQLAFTPDQKYPLATNGLSNDISVIDAAGLNVTKLIPVGRLPWGVTVSPK